MPSESLSLTFTSPADGFHETWADPTNAATSNDQRATVDTDLQAVDGDYSAALRATIANPDIPPNASNIVVTFSVERRKVAGQPADLFIKDYEVVLSDGSTTLDDKAKADDWPTTDTSVDYEWDADVTPSLINSGLLRFDLRIHSDYDSDFHTSPGDGAPIAQVDFISATVSYDVANYFDHTEEQLMTHHIDDTKAFYLQTRDATGAAANATGTPAYEVYEVNTDTPILTGSFTKDGSTTGFYYGSITLSAANGFEVGKCYCIRWTATVDSVAQAGVASGGAFVMRTAPLTAETDPFDEAPDAEATGRATTRGGLLTQIYARLFNYQTKNHSTGAVSVYKADSTTVMVSGTDTESESSSSAGKLE